MPGSTADIAHLFRRAGFSARPDELSYYAARGYEKAVADLVSGKPLMGRMRSTDETLDPVNALADNLGGRVAVQSLQQIQQTWLERMVTTSAPLVERMVLFLHNHWATGYRPDQTVDTPELEAQNRLFRSHALGDWRALCHAMIEDVALSCWLSNNVNVKEHPNENLAREFMELFTLGPGNYTETDVREAARALTGMVVVYNLHATGPRNAMAFDKTKHDMGTADVPPRAPMTILGQTGNFMPHDFVRIALQQDAAPRFLARKLAQTFVMPDPPDAYVGAVASALVASGWKLSAILRWIFLSDAFRSQAARSAIVKTPAEFVVGGLRALKHTSSDDYAIGLGWMNDQGQILYDPPNVGGWPKNMGWLGAGGVLARYNAGVQLADRHVAQTVLPTQKPIRSDSALGWGQIFGVPDLSRRTIDAMESYRAKAATTADAKTIDAGMMTLLVASPDYNLA